MITLHLDGKLAELFGGRVSLAVSTAREAVTALAYQSKQYRQVILDNDWHVFAGKGNDITEQELDMQLGDVTDIILTPVVQGSGSVVNFIVGGALLIAGTIVTGGLGTALMFAGGGMLVGGVVGLMMKPPKPETGQYDESDRKASFLFNGAVNTTTQGDAIQRGYGKMLVGSVVVSAALYAEDTE